MDIFWNYFKATYHHYENVLCKCSTKYGLTSLNGHVIKTVDNSLSKKTFSKLKQQQEMGPYSKEF